MGSDKDQKDPLKRWSLKGRSNYKCKSYQDSVFTGTKFDKIDDDLARIDYESWILVSLG